MRNVVCLALFLLSTSALVNPYTDFLAIVLKDLTKSRPELSTSIQSISDLYDAEFEQYCFTPLAKRSEFPSKSFYDRIVLILRMLNNSSKHKVEESVTVAKWLRVEMECYLSDYSCSLDSNNRKLEQFCRMERLTCAPPSQSSKLSTALRMRTDAFLQTFVGSAKVDKVLLETLFLGIRLVLAMYERRVDKKSMPSIYAAIGSASRYAAIRTFQVRRFLAAKSYGVGAMDTCTIDIPPFRSHRVTLRGNRPYSQNITADILAHASTTDNPTAWLKSILGRHRDAYSIPELILESLISKTSRRLPQRARLVMSSRQSIMAPQLTSRDPFPGIPSCIYSLVLWRFGNTRTHLQFLKLSHHIDDTLQDMFTTGSDLRNDLHHHLKTLVNSKVCQRSLLNRMMSADLLHLIMLIHDRICMTTVLLFLNDAEDEHAQYDENEFAMLREFKKTAASNTLASMGILPRPNIDSILAAFKKSMFMVLQYCSFASNADEIRADVSAYLAHIYSNSP